MEWHIRCFAREMHRLKENKNSGEKGRALDFPAWTSERVFLKGDEHFSELLKEISGARESVTLETYIFDRDRLGNAVLQALKAAAARGIVVRLLLDGFGCSQWSWSELHALARAGVKVKVYHPLPWQNPKMRWAGIFRFRRLLLGFWKLNRRNHRKCCIIDGTTAYLGGMNISSRQMESHAGTSAFRDTSVRIEGPAVTRLHHAFEHAWRHSRNLRNGKSGPDRSRFAVCAVRLNGSSQERRELNLDFLKRILRAKSRIWIANPYFAPDLSLVIALRFAARNGADVRLLFPRDNRVWGLKWAAKVFYLPLLSAGAAIYEYKPALLHAKVAIIDDWCLVGSSNLNQRSLLHDLEVDIVLEKPESMRALEAGYERDLLRSDRFDIDAWKGRNFFRRVTQRIMQRLALIFWRWI